MMCHSRFRSALFHPSCVFQVNFSCEKETAVTIWRLQRVDRHLIGYMTLSSSSTFVVVGPIDRHVCRTYDSSSVFSPLCSISVELTISPIPAYHKQKWPHRGPDPDRRSYLTHIPTIYAYVYDHSSFHRITIVYSLYTYTMVSRTCYLDSCRDGTWKEQIRQNMTWNLMSRLSHKFRLLIDIMLHSLTTIYAMQYEDLALNCRKLFLNLLLSALVFVFFYTVTLLQA